MTLLVACVLACNIILLISVAAALSAISKMQADIRFQFNAAMNDIRLAREDINTPKKEVQINTDGIERIITDPMRAKNESRP